MRGGKRGRLQEDHEKKAHRKYRDFEYGIFDGAPQALRELRQKGCVVALCTGDTKQSAKDFARIHKLTDAFRNTRRSIPFLPLSIRSLEVCGHEKSSRWITEDMLDKGKVLRHLAEKYDIPLHRAVLCDDQMGYIQQSAKLAQKQMEQGVRVGAAPLILTLYNRPYTYSESPDHTSRPEAYIEEYIRTIKIDLAYYDNSFSVFVATHPSQIPDAVEMLVAHIDAALKQGLTGGGQIFVPEGIQIEPAPHPAR